jgi:hypothetical protein
MKKEPIKIPFDEDGHQMTYAEGWQKITWVENYVFEDELEFVKHIRGRSAVNFVFKSASTGKELTASVSFVSDLFRGKFTDNVFFQKTETGMFHMKGRFTFRKQGSNYFLTGYKNEK